MAELKIMEIYATPQGCRLVLLNIPDDFSEMVVLDSDTSEIHKAIDHMLTTLKEAAEKHNKKLSSGEKWDGQD
jgi:hypothetical protein